MNKNSSMIRVYTILPPIVHVGIKFQPSRPHSSWETCDERRKILMFENWKERKMKNKETNKQQQPDFGIHDTSAYCPCVYQASSFTASQFLRKVWRKSVMFENWRERKSKRMNKQQQPDSGIHDTSAHCPCLYQVSTFLASKFLRKVWRKILMFENWRERKMKK